MLLGSFFALPSYMALRGAAPSPPVVLRPPKVSVAVGFAAPNIPPPPTLAEAAVVAWAAWD